jgi:hypothetical protein
VAFGTSVENCLFRTFGNTAIGVAGGHLRVTGCQFNGFKYAIIGYGAGIYVDTCRIEVCLTGICLGRYIDETAYACNQAAITSITFEADDTAIELYAVAAAAVSGVVIQGSPNAPSGQSIYGIEIRYTTAVTISSVLCGGNFNNAAFHMRSDGTLTNTTIISCLMFNSYPGAATWDIAGTVLPTSTWIPPKPALGSDIPVNTVPPALSHTTIAAGGTITCSDGTWTGLSVAFGTNYFRQWLRNGVVVSAFSSTEATYVTGPADVGATIICKTAAQNYGTAAYVTSSNSCAVT